MTALKNLWKQSICLIPQLCIPSFFIWTLKRVFAQKRFCCPAWMKSHSCQIQELAIHCLWTVFLLTIWGLPLCVTVSSLVSYLGLIPSFSVFYSLILVTCYSWWMKYLQHQENCKNGYHLLALMASQSPIWIHKICHFELQHLNRMKTGGIFLVF